MRFDYKVKIFEDPSSGNLEETVNDWFDGRYDIEVCNIEYRTNGVFPCLYSIKRSIGNNAKITSSFMRRCQTMFKKDRLVVRRRWKVFKYLGIIFRVITLPIFFWYRLHLWVWDGAIYDDIFGES